MGPWLLKLWAHGFMSYGLIISLSYGSLASTCMGPWFPRSLRSLVSTCNWPLVSTFYGVPGFLKLWVPGFIVPGAPGSHKLWVPGFLMPWAPGFLMLWAPGFLKLWVPGFLVIRASGFHMLWVTGFLVVWSPVFLCRVHGPRAQMIAS